MASARPFSPAALARLRRGYLYGGAILGLTWLAVSVGIGVDGGASVAARSQLLLVCFSGPAAILLALGLLAERSARTYNVIDQGFADAIRASFAGLLQLPRSAAYQVDPAGEDPAGKDPAGEELRASELLSVRRSVDPATAEALARCLARQSGDFPGALRSAYGPVPEPARPDRPLAGPAGAVRALLAADLPLSGTTQSHLADATVVTAGPVTLTGAAQPRWAALPAAAVESWLRDLLESVAHVLGGGTHASATVMAARVELIAHFGAAADLVALEGRLPGLATPGEARTAITVRGPRFEPEAWLATSVQIDDADPLLVLPTGFPGLLGRALGETARAGARTPDGG